MKETQLGGGPMFSPPPLRPTGGAPTTEIEADDEAGDRFGRCGLSLESAEGSPRGRARLLPRSRGRGDVTALRGSREY